jgi:hypothetical protein
LEIKPRAEQTHGLYFPQPQYENKVEHPDRCTESGMDAIIFNVGQEGWALEFEEEAS